MVNKNTLKYIFIISFAVAIIYPLVNIYVIFPSFRQLLVQDTEDDAVRVAAHILSMVVSNKNELNNSGEFTEMTEKAKEDFKLEKIKVFSKNGEIIFSTDPQDIGKINRKPYFYEIVARGNRYTKIVQKGTKTLEGRTVDVDVVETYVPIMKGDEFIGAFEIYYDVTARNMELNKTAFNASIISFVMVFTFFIITMAVLFREDRGTDVLEIKNLSIIDRSPFYLLFVVFIVIFIAELIVMLFLSVLSPGSDLVEAILDSSMLVMILSPFLYFFLLRPLTMHISMRKKAEEEMREAYHGLEGRIEKRTAELSDKNQQLEKEIIERQQVEKEKEILITELKEALAKVKTLRGLLPVCSSCSKIRDDHGNWCHVDVYIRDHSEAEITHGYCPECEKKHFPQNFKKDNE